MHFVRKVLEICGVSPQRLALEWASAAEGPLYVSLVTRFTDRVRELGPLGRHEQAGREELIRALRVAREAVSGLKLRTRLGKLAHLLREEKDYSVEHMDSKLDGKIYELIVSGLQGGGGFPQVAPTVPGWSGPLAHEEKNR